MRQPPFDHAPPAMQSEGRRIPPEVLARMNPFSPLVSATTRLGVRLRLNEAGPLLSLCTVSLFGWGFVKLAGEVMEGGTTKLDRAILLALRNPNDLSDPIGPVWFEEAARDVTGLGGHAILSIVTLASLAYLLLARKRGAAL